MSVVKKLSHSEAGGQGSARPVQFPEKQPLQMGDMGKGDPRLGTELPSATVPGTNPDLTSLGVPRLGTERGCRGSRW